MSSLVDRAEKALADLRAAREGVKGIDVGAAMDMMADVTRELMERCRGPMILPPTSKEDIAFTRAQLIREMAEDAETAIDEHRVIVGMDLRSKPRFGFPYAAKPKEVLKVFRRLLGTDMPKLGPISNDTPPDQVVKLLKKAYQHGRTPAELAVLKDRQKRRWQRFCGGGA